MFSPCSAMRAPIFTLLAALLVVDALPFVARDVYSPPITSPNAETIWNAGQVATVTWDTSNMPPDSQITNLNGKVVLGYLENDSMNLMYNDPLAKDFKLRDGQVNVTVPPSLVSRNDYIIVLFGDSGNASPEFVIRGTADEFSSAISPSESLITTPIPITGTEITGGSTPTSSDAISLSSSATISVTVSASAPTSSGVSSTPPATVSSTSTFGSSQSTTAFGANETDNGARSLEPSMLSVGMLGILALGVLCQ